MYANKKQQNHYITFPHTEIHEQKHQSQLHLPQVHRRNQNQS